MKKKLFFAAVVATALAGCSSNENLENDLANVATSASQQESRVPIVLGLNNPDVQVLKTRGTGTVGDIAGAPGTTNIYRNEDLWVLMTTIGKTPWDFTNHAPEETDPEVLGYQFDGTFKARPYGYEGDLTDPENVVIKDPLSPAYGEDALFDDEHGAMQNTSKWGIDYKSYNENRTKYYPMDGTASDFFAFHIDDATTLVDPESLSTPENPIIDHGYNIPTITKVAAEGDNPAKMTVDFTIDGTQDILVGKAVNGAPTNVPERTGFTQKTARENLVPNIPMKHMLTRLTFDLVPGHQDAEGVIVSKIVVKSKSKGTLTVAYDKEGGIGNVDEGAAIAPEDLIEWDAEEEEPATFELKKPAATPYAMDGSKNPLVEVATPFDADDAATYLAKLVASPTADSEDPAYVANNNIMPNSAALTDPEADPYIFTPARMGDAMFVQPNQTEFEVTATMLFPIEGYDQDPTNAEYLTKTYTFYVRVKNAQGAVVENGLLLGNSYNVQLKVYGLSKVVLRTTLEAWEDGGNIEIDTDDPSNTVTWEELPDPAPAPAPEPEP